MIEYRKNFKRNDSKTILDSRRLKGAAQKEFCTYLFSIAEKAVGGKIK